MNVVLFHKASRVQDMDTPKGTEIRASLYENSDEGQAPDYWVWEETPPEASPPPEPEDDFLAGFLPGPIDSHGGRYAYPALQLDTDALEVHHVKRVSFKVHRFKVRRHRMEKRKLEF
jgi:hypothetical protein